MSIGTVTVASAAALKVALASATGGETILLQGGDYGGIDLGRHLGAHPGGPVTLKAADPALPPVFSALTLTGVSNVVFDGVAFDYHYQAGDAVSVPLVDLRNSQDITFAQCRFTGDDAVSTDPAIDGYPSGYALRLLDAQGITVTDSSLTGFWKGVMIQRSAGVVISRNDISGLRSDGIDIVDSRSVRVEDNHIHDFERSYNSSDHADMIQGWTATTNAASVSSDITIRGNLLDLGDGGWTQSIFFGNPQVDSQGMGDAFRFRNVVIENNVIINDHIHGISMGATDGLVIRHNTLLHGIDESAHLGTYNAAIDAPEIWVSGGSDNVTIESNVAAGFGGGAGLPGWTVSGNFPVQDKNPGAPGWYGDVFVNPDGGFGGTPENAQTLPGSALALSGAGAPQLAYDATPDSLTALMHVTGGAEDNVFTYDAGLSAGPSGVAAAAGAQFLWDFGDGTGAAGVSVTHVYAGAGHYDATLAVVMPDGSRDTTEARAEIAGPDVLSFDPQQGSFIRETYGDDAVLGGTLPLAQTASGQVIDLPSAGATALPGVGLSALLGSEGFRIATTLRSDAAAPVDAGVLLLAPGVLRAAITTTGALDLLLVTANGSQARIVTGPTTVLDGAWHDLEITYDGSTGGAGLTLGLDGVTLGQKALTGDLAASGPTALSLGSAFQDSFSGQIAAFEIDSDARMAAVPVAPPAPPEEVSLFDAHQVFDQDFDPAADPLLASALKGAAHFDLYAAAPVLVLDGGGHFVIGEIDPIRTSATAAFLIDFARNAADGSRGMLIQNHRALEVQIVDERLALGVAKADGTMHRVFSGDLGLDDTDLHRLIVTVDSGADRLTVDLDGAEVLEIAGIDIDLPQGLALGKGWTLGNRWGSDTFDVDITDFRVADLASAPAPSPALSPAPAPAPAPAPSDPDSFDFAAHQVFDQDFDAAADPLLAGALRGAASFDPTGNEPALRLEGGHFVIGEIDPIRASTSAAFLIDFARNAADGSRGVLMQNHQALDVQLVGGSLKISVAKADGTMYRVLSGDLGLDDTDLHRLIVTVDSGADRLTVDLDGAEVLEIAGIDIDLPQGLALGKDWTLGNRWGSDTFDVDITDFRVADLSGMADGFGLG